MAGFRKAKAQQAALKIGFYGAPGSGKTFTSLLVAEGLAKRAGKKVAYVDTERGTDFYSKTVPDRSVHPEAFDFDALYTRSLTEVIDEIKALSPDEYGVLVIDSVTHLWEAAKAAYSGKQTKAGTIPFQAWNAIKKPYKELMSLLLSSPMHVIICGRQGVEYEKDEETDELNAVGYKMKAEGETPYEPHILIRMESVKPKRSNELATIYAYAEKDRTGVLAGKTLSNPTFDSLCLPLLGLLGGEQAKVYSEDEVAVQDAERLAEQEQTKSEQSAVYLNEFLGRIMLAKTLDDLKKVGKAITKEIKASMLTAHVTEVRDKYQEKETALEKGQKAASGSEATEVGDATESDTP